LSAALSWVVASLAASSILVEANFDSICATHPPMRRQLLCICRLPHN
jgi:hypothetical protein